MQAAVPGRLTSRGADCWCGTTEHAHAWPASWAGAAAGIQLRAPTSLCCGMGELK